MARNAQLARRQAQRSRVAAQRRRTSTTRTPSVLPRSKYFQRQVELKREAEFTKQQVNKIVKDIEAGKYSKLSQIPQQYRRFIKVTQAELDQINKYYGAKRYEAAYNQVMKHYRKGMLWAVAAFGEGLEQQIARKLIKQGYASSKLALERQATERSDAIKSIRAGKIKGVKIVGNRIIGPGNKPITLSNALKKQAADEVEKNFLSVGEKFILDKNYNIQGISSGLLSQSIPYTKQGLEYYSQRIAALGGLAISKNKPTFKQIVKQKTTKPDYDLSKNLQPGEKYIYDSTGNKIVSIKSKALDKTFPYTQKGRELYNTRMLMMFPVPQSSGEKRARWGNIIDLSSSKGVSRSVVNLKNLLTSSTKQVPKVLWDYTKSLSRGTVKTGLYIIDNAGVAFNIRYNYKTLKFEIPKNKKITYITDGWKIKKWAKYNYKTAPWKDPDYQNFAITGALAILGGYSLKSAKVAFGAIKGKAVYEFVKDPSPYNLAVVESLFIPGLAKRGVKLGKRGVKLGNKALNSKQMKALGIKVNEIKAVQKVRGKNFRYKTLQSKQINQIRGSIQRADIKKSSLKNAKKYRAIAKKKALKRTGADKYKSSKTLLLRRKLGVDRILKELDSKIEVKTARMSQRMIRKLRSQGYKVNKQMEKKLFDEIHRTFKKKYKNSDVYQKLKQLAKKDIETTVQLNRYKNSYILKQGLKNLKNRISKVNDKGLRKLKSVKAIQKAKIKQVREPIKEADLKKATKRNARKYRIKSKQSKQIKSVREAIREADLKKAAKSRGKRYRIKSKQNDKIKSVRDSIKEADMKKIAKRNAKKYRAKGKKQYVKRMKKYQKDSARFKKEGKYVGQEYVRAGRNKWRPKSSQSYQTVKIKTITQPSKGLTYRKMNTFIDTMFRELAKRRNVNTKNPQYKIMKNALKKGMARAIKNKDYKTINNFKQAVLRLSKELDKKKNTFKVKGSEAVVDKNNKVVKRARTIKTIKDFEVKAPEGKYVEVKVGQQVMLQRVKQATKSKQASRSGQVLTKVLIIRQVTKPSLSLASLLSLFSMSALSAGSLTLTRSASKSRSALRSRQDIRSATSPRTGLVSKTAQNTSQRITPLTASQVKPRQKNQPALRSKYKTKKEKKKPIAIPSLSGKEKTRTLSKQVMTYGVMIKRGNKYVKLRLPPLTARNAKDILVYNLDHNTARTGKIVKLGKTKKVARVEPRVAGYSSKHSNKIRRYRIRKKKKVGLADTYIEKTRYSLDKSGERVKRKNSSKPRRKASPTQLRALERARRARMQKNKQLIRSRAKRLSKKTTIKRKRTLTPTQKRVLVARLKRARAVRARNLRSGRKK